MYLSDFVKGYPDLTIENLENNSKRVCKNTLFFAENTEHIAEAIKNGAVAVVSENEISVSVPVIYVEDIKRAESEFADKFFEYPLKKIRIISVVGTNGKTTTCHVISHILNASGKKCGIIGTLGAKWGNSKVEFGMTSPDRITFTRILKKMVDDGVEYAAVEVSAHAIAQNRFCKVRSDVAIFTNFSEDHLDYFGNMSDYEKCKLSYFKSENLRIAVTNSDDEVGRKLIKKSDFPVVCYGIDNPSDVFAVNVDCVPDETDFVLNIFDEIYRVRYGLVGKFNCYNVLAAVTAARLIGISGEACVSALKSLKPAEGRYNVFDFRFGKVIIDFAHTPDGLRNLLQTATVRHEGKLIVIMGCGGERDKNKRPLMGKIASVFADIVIVTSDNPRGEEENAIITDIVKGIKGKYLIIPDRKKAIEYALSVLNGDTLVIAGKGGEKYIEKNGRSIPFSDEETVKAYIKIRK